MEKKKIDFLKFIRKKDKKIALVLGGGGPKGLAHIGVIKVLLGAGIRFDLIIGTSIGALIGGAYSVSGSIDKVEEIATSTDAKTVLSMLFDPSIRMGLIKGEKIRKFILEKIGNPEIETLNPKFLAVATDLNSGNPVVFSEGNLVDAVRASISIPFVFQPVKFGNTLLADGGLSQNVPVDIARKKGADFVIAVNLSSKLSESFYGLSRTPAGLYRIANESINILSYNLSKLNCKDADVVITPKVYDVGWDSFWKPAGVIRRGEKAAQELLDEILEKLKS